MKLDILMVIKAVIVLVFGICFIAIPQPLLSLYDITLNDSGIYMTRLFGAAFILLGVLLWFGRKDPGSPTQRALVYGIFIGDSIGFIIALLGQIHRIANALGWLTVALYFFLAAGFGYFQFKRTSST